MPEILSWGIAYKGFERALIDVDLRYFDYENTSSLRHQSRSTAAWAGGASSPWRSAASTRQPTS